ncbi:MAG: hypothetical protein ABI954_01480 [Pyrinomonadaceae bacterium]
MNKKCLHCGLTNFQFAEICQRCSAKLPQFSNSPVQISTGDDLGKKLDAGAIWFFKRFLTALGVSVMLLVIAYISLIYSAAQLSGDQKEQVDDAIKLLDERGFKREAFLLRWSAFRANDNWFNVLTKHDNAYAATNFPFQIVTVYEDFFKKSVDTTERAAILLHEAQHLQGAGEEKAYEYTWRSRAQLGWTRQVYGLTYIYLNVLKSTRETVPELFQCEDSIEQDCSE